MPMRKEYIVRIIIIIMKLYNYIHKLNNEAAKLCIGFRCVCNT